MKLYQTMKKILLVSRPVSWPNTAYPFAAAYIVGRGEDTVFFLIGTLYFLIPYNILMYGINDVFDYESDIKNPRKGGIEGMRESRALHPAIIGASILTNAPFLLYLGLQSELRGLVTLGLVVGFVIAYSVAVLRFKERPVLDSITSSIHFVGPMVFGLVSAGWNNNYLPYVLAFFLWGIASHAFGAVQDIIPDRKGGISSIATTFGAQATVRLSFVMYLMATFVLVAASLKAIPVAIAGFAYCCNIAPFLHTTDKTSAQTNAGWRRFLWLNYATGFVLTITLIWATWGK